MIKNFNIWAFNPPNPRKIIYSEHKATTKILRTKQYQTKLAAERLRELGSPYPCMEWAKLETCEPLGQENFRKMAATPMMNR
jgi:hypothetical protein